MKAEHPQSVKYFIGALYSDAELLEKAQYLCAESIGEIDFYSKSFPFEVSSYYDEEMGRPLFRLFFSFKKLKSPGDLAGLKIKCNEIEDLLQVDASRKVNLDIGYLDYHKMLLASAKYNGQKIYLDQGIYADPTLIFENGQFRALENTFPDFRSGLYNEVFMTLRGMYKEQLKTLNSH
ncbi:DUF4416 family protein [bacterium]|nr:DUF4416 family protein [bacterium]